MKKLGIYLSIIVVLFGALYVVNQQANQAKYGKYADNVYGIDPSKLHPETLKLLDDPNYQNIILPDALDKKIAAQEDFFPLLFCIHLLPLQSDDSGADACRQRTERGCQTI